MKYLRYLAILAAIIGVLVISAPVSANTAQTYTYSASGIEIFAGLHFNGNTYGATFVAQTQETDSINTPPYNGILTASVNYKGLGPDATTGYNEILGGNWTLTITKGNVTGTITGCIIGGTDIYWSPSGTTNVGAVTLNLSITGGSGGFAHITKGPGSSFTGTDNHQSGLYLGSIQIPTVNGTLYVKY